MRIALLCLAFTFMSCAATGPAGTRRVAKSRLRACIADQGNHTVSYFEKIECVQESKRFCAARGIEETCATDGW